MRVARELLAPVLDEDLLRSGHARSPSSCSRDSRPDTTQPSVVGPGGVGQASDVPLPAPSAGRRRAAEDVVVGVQDVDVGIGRERRV